MAAETRIDGFLDGRLRIEQPLQGYRAGADAVMLAAACPARAGEKVIEPGCGAGVASLCLARRVPDAMLTGIELQPDYAGLARANAGRNAVDMRVIEADLFDLPAGLRDESFDCAILNPPYFTCADPASPVAGRDVARRESRPVAAWIDAALRRLHPGGRLVLIHRAERLADLLAAVAHRAGSVRILPLASRRDRPAGRLILGAVKGAKGPLSLLPPLILHEADRHLHNGEDQTPEARAILRNAAAINLWT